MVKFPFLMGSPKKPNAFSGPAAPRLRSSWPPRWPGPNEARALKPGMGGITNGEDWWFYDGLRIVFSMVWYALVCFHHQDEDLTSDDFTLLNEGIVGYNGI